jgi:hypothetical protein
MLHGKNKAAEPISKQKRVAFTYKVKIPVTAMVNRDFCIKFR